VGVEVLVHPGDEAAHDKVLSEFVVNGQCQNGIQDAGSAGRVRSVFQCNERVVGTSVVFEGWVVSGDGPPGAASGGAVGDGDEMGFEGFECCHAIDVEAATLTQALLQTLRQSNFLVDPPRFLIAAGPEMVDLTSADGICACQLAGALGRQTWSTNGPCFTSESTARTNTLRSFKD
jgi:hypothetical protein